MKPLKDSKFVIPKSRYDTIDCYLASAEYNDKEVPYNSISSSWTEVWMNCWLST